MGMGSGYVYRSWWTGRTLRLTAGLVLLVLLVRLGWGWQAGRMLAGQVEAIRARGEPAAAEDFVVVRVPDERNAFEFQMQAAASHVRGVTSPHNSPVNYPDYPPFNPQWHQLAQLSEQSHQKVFAMARQARQFDQVQTHDRYRKPLLANMLNWLNPSRQLANTLADGAVYAHLTGNDAEALERVQDILHLARSLRQDEFMVSHLVAMGIDALAYDATQKIAPGLRIDGQAGAATRPQVRALIDQLLDEREAWAGLERSLRGERVAAMDYADHLADGTWCVHPLVQMQHVRTNPIMDQTLEGMRRGNWADAQSAMQSHSRYIDENMLHGFSGSMVRYSRFFGGRTPYVVRYCRTHFRSIAERRMTAVALAVRLYRIDHGKWPEKLADLAPAYISEIPKDPFCNDGRTIGYRLMRGGLPDGTDRPLLYVEEGPDLPRTIRATPMYSWETDPGPPPLKESFRQYRDLVRFVPVLPPETVEDDPEKPDAPGDDKQQDNEPSQP